MHCGEGGVSSTATTTVPHIARYVNALGPPGGGLYCNSYGFPISRGILFLFFKEYIFRLPAAFFIQTFEDGSLDPGRFPTNF